MTCLRHYEAAAFLCSQVDPVCFEEFHTWRLQPSLCEEGQFLSQIIKDDIRPCMAFSNTEVGHIGSVIFKLYMEKFNVPIDSIASDYCDQCFV